MFRKLISALASVLHMRSRPVQWQVSRERPVEFHGAQVFGRSRRGAMKLAAHTDIKKRRRRRIAQHSRRVNSRRRRGKRHATLGGV